MEMAASELSHPSTSNTSLLSSATLMRSLHQYKEKATDHLLLRDFEECKKTCDNGIAFAKLHIEEESAQETIESLCLLCIQAFAELNSWQDVLPYVQNVYSGIEACPSAVIRLCAQETIESLCLLCIQAFAELNSWQDVLPYVQNVYSGIEACPSAVIRLCILLHAKVKEYPKCYAVASIWLKCSDNVTKPGYEDVAALYVTYVLIPQKQITLAGQFLSSCTHLDCDTRDQILRNIKSDSSTVKAHEINTETSQFVTDTSHDTETKEDNGSSLDSLRRTVKNFGVMIASKLSFINFKTVVKLAMVTTCLYLVAIQANKGDLMTNIGRASVVWQGAMKILKSMFGPYRPGR